MKKFIISILIFCYGINLLLMLSSCSEMHFVEESEMPTEETTAQIVEESEMPTEETTAQIAELKKFADPALIYKLQDGMDTEEVKRALGAAPIKLGNFIDAFIFTNGLVVYVGQAYLKYDNAVNPNMVQQISIGDSYSDVVLALDAIGIQPYNRYGCIAFCLSDGRTLHIEFTVDYFVESFSVSDN